MSITNTKSNTLYNLIEKLEEDIADGKELISKSVIKPLLKMFEVVNGKIVTKKTYQIAFYAPEKIYKEDFEKVRNEFIFPDGLSFKEMYNYNYRKFTLKEKYENTKLSKMVDGEMYNIYNILQIAQNLYKQFTIKENIEKLNRYYNELDNLNWFLEKESNDSYLSYALKPARMKIYEMKNKWQKELEEIDKTYEALGVKIKKWWIFQDSFEYETGNE